MSVSKKKKKRAWGEAEHVSDLILYSMQTEISFSRWKQSPLLGTLYGLVFEKARMQMIWIYFIYF